MTGVTSDGLQIDAQNLATISPSPYDHNRLFNHDGSEAITLTSGDTISDPGLYLWDTDQDGWRPVSTVNEDNLEIGLEEARQVNDTTDGGIYIRGASEFGSPSGTPSTDSTLLVDAGTNSAIGLQVADDAASTTDDGYAASLDYFSEAGERLARLAADTTHNHWGIYTKGDAPGSGDTQPVKRLNVGGGEEVSDIQAYAVDVFRVGPRTGNSGDYDMDFIIESESTGDTYLRLDHDGSQAGAMVYDQSRASVRLQNFKADTADFLEFRQTNEIRAHDNDLVNVGYLDANSIEAGGDPVATTENGEKIWVIAAGASDPTNADPNDIIFEEEA